MDIREQILNKYREFSEFLDEIELNGLRQKLSRQELNEFENKLRTIDIRSLPYEISKMTEEMKKEEFPQLLGVHHFPLIQDIDFLNENEKIELDKFLVKHRVGNYVSGLWHVTYNESKREQLEKWLNENEVTEDVYAIICPRCSNGHISTIMTKAEKEEFENHFHRYRKTSEWEDYEKADKYIEYICMDCDEETALENLSDVQIKEMFKMKMKRDTSLDNA